MKYRPEQLLCIGKFSVHNRLKRDTLPSLTWIVEIAASSEFGLRI